MSDTKRAIRETWKVFGPAIVLTIVGFIVAYQFVRPAPPHHIVIGTASPEGAYHAFASRYAQILGRHGVDLKVLATAGSIENLRLLQEEGGVDVALVQGGTGLDSRDAPIVSLASLYYEPLWVFHRRDLGVEYLADLRGRRIAVGPEGSGSRPVATTLLRENGIAGSPTELVDLTGPDAAEALVAGTIDAAFFVASPSAGYVRRLCSEERVELLSFRRAEAYTRMHRYLSSLVLPEGVIDPAAGIPPSDRRLVAPTANLVARASLHPALVDLVLQAATEVHGGGGLFEEPGQFPSKLYVEFPLSPDAARYFERGPSFLQRYLPFWAATLVERMKVMLLPLVALLLPLFRIAPPTYRWRVRSRIYRWYRELQAVDLRIRRDGDPSDTARNLAELDRLEEEVRKVTIPLSYAYELFSLRQHIDMIREKARRAGPA